MSGARHLRADWAALSAEIDEVTATWDATEEVDTNLGADIQGVAERLAATLHALISGGAVDEAVDAELRVAVTELDGAVSRYEALGEHDTSACIDIVDRLGPAAALADRVLSPGQGNNK